RRLRQLENRVADHPLVSLSVCEPDRGHPLEGGFREPAGDPAAELHHFSGVSPFQRKPFFRTKQMLPPSRDNGFFSNSSAAEVSASPAGSTILTVSSSFPLR